MQLFQITPNDEAIAVRAHNMVRDNLQDDGVYIIIDDNKKIVWLFKGHKADLMLQIIGATLQDKMLLSLKSTYRSNDLNKYKKDSEIFTEVMDATVKPGLAKEIHKQRKENEESPTEEKRRAFMTFAASRMQETCVHKGVNTKEIIQEVLEFENPPGFIRHMSMVAGNMYNEDTVVEKFITDNKKHTTLKKIGILPNGFYFLENMSSRLYIKDGKVACLDLMVEKDRDLGENRVLVPILHKEKINRKGDINILLNAFKPPKSDEVGRGS